MHRIAESKTLPQASLHAQFLAFVAIGNTSAVENMLTAHAELFTETVESKDHPLIIAAGSYQLETLELLLALGFDVLVIPKGEKDPVWSLAVKKCTELKLDTSKSGQDSKHAALDFASVKKDMAAILELAAHIKNDQLSSSFVQSLSPNTKAFGLILASLYGKKIAAEMLLAANAGAVNITVVGRNPEYWAQKYCQEACHRDLASSIQANNANDDKKSESSNSVQVTTTLPQEGLPEIIAKIQKQKDKTPEEKQKEILEATRKFYAAVNCSHTVTEERKSTQAQKQDAKEIKELKREAKESKEEKNKSTSSVSEVDLKFDILLMLYQAMVLRCIRNLIDCDNFPNLNNILKTYPSLLDFAANYAYVSSNFGTLYSLLVCGANHNKISKSALDRAISRFDKEMKDAAEAKATADAKHDQSSATISEERYRQWSEKKQVAVEVNTYFEVDADFQKNIESLYQAVKKIKEENDKIALSSRQLESCARSDEKKDEKKDAEKTLAQKKAVIVNILYQELERALNPISSDTKETICANLNIYDKIELNATIASFLKIVNTVKNETDLNAAIEGFFILRQVAIADTDYDYCFSYSPATRICLEVAEKHFPARTGFTSLNRLLYPSGYNNDQPWHDPYSQETTLPNGDFIRFQGGLYRISSLVTMAIANLKKGEMSLEGIWKGSATPDGKDFVPLSKEALLRVKQFSPTLSKLAIYTDTLNTYQCSQMHEAKQDFFTCFEFLAKNLHENSKYLANGAKVATSGTEEKAGESLYPYLVEFKTWWDGLKEKSRISQLCLHVPNTDGLGNRDLIFGDIIARIFDPRPRDARDVHYCTFNKAHELDLFLASEGFKKELSLISTEAGLAIPPFVSHRQLDIWQKQIEIELLSARENPQERCVRCIEPFVPIEEVKQLPTLMRDNLFYTYCRYYLLTNQQQRIRGLYDLARYSEQTGKLENLVVDISVILYFSKQELTNRIYGYGYTIIHYLVERKNWFFLGHVLHYVIAEGIVATSSDDEQYWYALVTAAREDNVNICDLILSIKNNHGVLWSARSALYPFIDNNRTGLIEKFLGNSPPARDQNIQPNLIVYAVYARSVLQETFELLLKYFPDLVKQKTGENIPLRSAIYRIIRGYDEGLIQAGDEQTVAIKKMILWKIPLLIKAGASLCARARDDNAMTGCYYLATEYNDFDVIAAIVNSLTDAREENVDDYLQQFLSIAAARENFKICTLFHEKIPRIVYKNPSIIRFYIACNEANLVTTWAQGGGDINAPILFSNRSHPLSSHSPLTYACMWGNLEAFQAVLEAEVDLTSPRFDFQSHLQVNASNIQDYNRYFIFPAHYKISQGGLALFYLCCYGDTYCNDEAVLPNRLTMIAMLVRAGAPIDELFGTSILRIVGQRKYWKVAKTILDSLQNRQFSDGDLAGFGSLMANVTDGIGFGIYLRIQFDIFHRLLEQKIIRIIGDDYIICALKNLGCMRGLINEQEKLIRARIQSLNTVSFCGAGLNDSHLNLIAKAMDENQNLSELDIRENKFTQEGLKAFVTRIINQNPRLVTIKVDEKVRPENLDKLLARNRKFSEVDTHLQTAAQTLAKYRQHVTEQKELKEAKNTGKVAIPIFEYCTAQKRLLSAYTLCHSLTPSAMQADTDDVSERQVVECKKRLDEFNAVCEFKCDAKTEDAQFEDLLHYFGDLQCPQIFASRARQSVLTFFSAERSVVLQTMRQRYVINAMHIVAKMYAKMITASLETNNLRVLANRSLLSREFVMLQLFGRANQALPSNSNFKSTFEELFSIWSKRVLAYGKACLHKIAEHYRSSLEDSQQKSIAELMKINVFDEFIKGLASFRGSFWTGFFTVQAYFQDELATLLKDLQFFSSISLQNMQQNQATNSLSQNRH